MSKAAPRPVLTFIVRTSRDSAGRLRGTVERVRTGQKERFTDAEGIGGVIERMFHDEQQTERR